MKRILPLLGSLAGTLVGAGVSLDVRAQGYALEGAVIDSRSSQNLGVVSERGDMATLFRAQKAMTFGILRSAGISLDQLAPEVRARIERFQTTNLDAFRAFSQGLALKDQGKFVEAKEYFRRAAELDPGFSLAVEQRQAMPDVNLGTGIATRAVIATAAGNALDRGKATFAVDVNRALAAISAGQTVLAVNVPDTNAQALSASGYTVNAAGSSSNFLPNLVAGLSYTFGDGFGNSLSIASTNEWRPDKYTAGSGANAGTLDSVGQSGDFLAQRGGASTTATGRLLLSDGATTAYWGTWLSTPAASASVTVGGQPVTAPTLGAVDYVMAEATRQMPTTGTATFTPAGGPLSNVSGSIAVNFVNRNVQLNNLGFDIGAYSFSGLTGLAQYDANTASGKFSGSYSGGSCNGCIGFLPTGSVFGGNFVGTKANGLVFSTILLTGSGQVSGVHLFGRP
jgi:hypothetical protein